MNEFIYEKTCPDCGATQSYSNKYKLERAVVAHSLCSECSRHKPSKKRQDLTGNIYGRLVVLGLHEKRDNHQYWKCKCGCGKETIIRHSHLTKQTVRSCGCSHFYLKEKHPHWKGFGEISGAMFTQIRRSAMVRGLNFNLTKQQLWQKYLDQNKQCALTGVSLTFDSALRHRDGTASLDRIDSTKDYDIDNVQWVHKIVNVMKQDLPEPEFVNWCKLICERRAS